MTTTGVTTRADGGSGWQLATDAAAAYERYLVPVIFRRAAERLVARAGVVPGDDVLDGACGTGVVARRVAAVVGPDGTVTALDRNRDMLAVAAAATAGTTPPVALVEGVLEEMPFGDDRFDVAIVQEALQFVDDPVVVLRELARVTAPGGTVATSVFRGLDHHPVYALLTDALRRHVGEEAATMMASPFAFGTAGRLREVAHDAGLVDVRVVVTPGSERFGSVAALVQQEAASSPLAAALAAVAPTTRDALVADLEDRLAPWIDDEGVCFHNETHVLTARVAAR